MKGTILGFSGSWGSGIAILTIKTERGEVKNIYCENPQIVRTLDFIFGNVITTNHRIDVCAVEGKKINYEVDDFGILGWISPNEEDE